MALRAKIGPDEAEPEGCGGSTVKGENEVWPDFSPQPFGPGPIFPISSSIVASRHPVCVTPHSLNSEKLAPGATAPVVGTGPNDSLALGLPTVTMNRGPTHLQHRSGLAVEMCAACGDAVYDDQRDLSSALLGIACSVCCCVDSRPQPGAGGCGVEEPFSQF